MIFLRPIGNDEESYNLIYSFTKNNNPYWKQNFLMANLLQGINTIKQGNMSDYDFFKLLYQNQKLNETIPSYTYMLIKNNIPIVSIYIMKRNENIADISFTTDIKYRRQGFATKALKMVEQMLFQNPDILFTTIIDKTPDKITSKLVLKSGYVYLEEKNYFIKANPNINLEDLKSKKI